MIEASGVQKWYPNGFHALRGCDLRVARGEVVVIMGPSGSGKSTFLRTFNALEDFQQGSIVIDGTSLTTNAVDGTDFTINLIPHTLENTTLNRLQPGSKVNLEVDLIARYCERLLSATPAA